MLTFLDYLGLEVPIPRHFELMGLFCVVDLYYFWSLRCRKDVGWEGTSSHSMSREITKQVKILFSFLTEKLHYVVKHAVMSPCVSPLLERGLAMYVCMQAILSDTHHAWFFLQAAWGIGTARLSGWNYIPFSCSILSPTHVRILGWKSTNSWVKTNRKHLFLIMAGFNLSPYICDLISLINLEEHCGRYKPIH